MRVQDGLHLVLRSIHRSMRKSLLTSLGIAIGIAAVVLLTAIGSGLQQYVVEKFTQFGTRIIAITPGKQVTHGLGSLLSSVRPLSLADADALSTLPHVEQVVPLVQGAGTVEYGKFQRNSTIMGVGPQMAEAWNFDLAAGRFLPAGAGRSRAFAVLGHTMKQELFGQQNALGQLIRVGGLRFRVVGVIEPKGQMLGFDMDDIVYIPAQRGLQLFNREGLMEVDVVFSAATTADAIRDRVSRLLVDRHGREDFTIITQDQMLDTLGKVLSVLTAAIAGLGSISLLVGAVGILTIMITTVRERTGEIGLLRAMGATRGQILALFLGEAVVLALLGGVLGLLGLLLIVLAMQFLVPQLPLSLNPLYWVAALLFSALIGLLAGVVPARNAARLNPIDALHAE